MKMTKRQRKALARAIKAIEAAMERVDQMEDEFPRLSDRAAVTMVYGVLYAAVRKLDAWSARDE